MPRIPATARALAFALLLLHTMGAAVENGDDAGEVLYVELGGRVAILTARCCARLAEGSTRPLKLDDEDYDVVVYGATSGGVVAAVAAVRAGAPRVALLDPGSRIGGMSAGGLSSTDTGNAAVIGGMARQFYLDNGRHYNLSQPEYSSSRMLRCKSFSKWLWLRTSLSSPMRLLRLYPRRVHKSHR